MPNIKRFYTDVSRYVENPVTHEMEFHAADVEHPAIVKIDVDKFNPDNDRHLFPVDKAPLPEANLKPAFNGRKNTGTGRLPAEETQAAAAAEGGGESEPARPSDLDPATQG